ncbi:MAG: CAP domain-containing protein, partial [Leptospira sp.]|nr:CAP domain-containing protein [Leptospira sp.]
MKSLFAILLSLTILSNCSILPDNSSDNSDLQNLLLIILADRQNRSAYIPSSDLTGEALEFHRLINRHRASVGCGALEEQNIGLSAVALAHSQDMRNNNKLSHDSSDGTTFGQRIRNAGISYSSAGENIAQGQRSGQAVFNSWLNSTGHRTNMENCNYTHHGVGHV